MKIEGNLPNFGTPLAGRVDAAEAAEGKAPGARAVQQGRDEVTVSADAQLASSAVEAAKLASDVRPDAVARGKALLESGKLGTDTNGLADALIDRMLNS